jgi:PAS domain S-box-containing protein
MTLDQQIPLSEKTRHAVLVAMRWLGAFLCLVVLGWIMTRANYLTVRQEAKAKKVDAQTAVARTANFGQVIVDGSGKIIAWNRGMSETTGWRADQMIGKQITDVLAAGAEDSKVVRAMLEGGAASGNMLLKRAGTKTGTVLIHAHVNTADDFRFVTAEPAGAHHTL